MCLNSQSEREGEREIATTWQSVILGGKVVCPGVISIPTAFFFSFESVLFLLLPSLHLNLLGIFHQMAGEQVAFLHE